MRLPTWFHIAWIIACTQVLLSATADSTQAVPVDPIAAADEKAGQPPFEITWANRGEYPPARVAFDNLEGWSTTLTGDATVSVQSSIAQRIWRASVMKVSYASGTGPTTAVIRPPHPVEISGKFDAAQMWVYGGWYRKAQDDKRPPLIRVLLEDQTGRPFHIELGAVVSGNWSIEQGTLSREACKDAKFPLKFTGIEVRDLDFPGGSSEIYFESLAFYQQLRDPHMHRFAPLNNQVPTSDAGMLPTPPANIAIRAEAIENGARFTSSGPDGDLQFDITPANGVLAGVFCQWKNGKPFQPAANGAVLVDAGSGKAKPAVGTTVTAASLKDNIYSVEWQEKLDDKVIPISAKYFLSGRTLVVDVASAGGCASGIDVGEVVGLNSPRAVFVPFLALERIGHTRTAGPMIACAKDVFVSVLPDIYHSDFSTLENTPAGPDGDTIRLFTGTSYLPLSNGRRNDLHDRILISASPQFEDVLPNARNPVSPNRERLAPYMFFSTYYPALKLFETIHRFGVDRVIVMDKNGCLVGAGNEGLSSFPYRWRPMPEVPIAKFQNYIQGVKSLGYLFSQYNFFPDVSPTNEFWDENRVALRPDGSLAQGDWYGDYSVKINDASRMVAALSPLVKDLYAPDCTYLDTQTNIGPSAVDFEAGVEGAGIGRVHMLANADVMLEARKFYGLTISEGYHRWLYAGACDVDYATMLFPPSYKSSSEVPPLVDFDLLKIHPFEHGTMMSFEPKYFLEEEGAEWNELLKEDGRGLAPIGFYKYVATSLAYGHMAMLGYDYIPHPARIIQLYALMQGVQSEYLTDNAKQISYHDGKSFLPTSDALREDAVRKGRVRVRYSRGLTVFANLNSSEIWNIEYEGKTFELPPWGWLIRKPGQLLAFSANMNGGRVDAVQCESYTYVNSGEQLVRLEEWGLEVKGAVWIKRRGSDGWQIIPCGDLGKWEEFHPETWPANFFAFEVGEISKDRGLASLKLEAKRWLAKPPAETNCVGRAFDLSVSKTPLDGTSEGWVQLHREGDFTDFLLTPK